MSIFFLGLIDTPDDVEEDDDEEMVLFDWQYEKWPSWVLLLLFMLLADMSDLHQVVLALIFNQISGWVCQ